MGHLYVCLNFFCDVLSMEVFTTSRWQASGQLVQALNVHMVDETAAHGIIKPLPILLGFCSGIDTVNLEKIALV